jgi:hypothetical protein
MHTSPRQPGNGAYRWRPQPIIVLSWNTRNYDVVIGVRLPDHSAARLHPSTVALGVSRMMMWMSPMVWPYTSGVLWEATALTESSTMAYSFIQRDAWAHIEPRHADTCRR